IEAANALRIRQASALRKHNIVAPLAARLTPSRMRARRRSMRHVVAKAARDDAAAFGAVHGRVLPTADGVVRAGPGSSTISLSRSRAGTWPAGPDNAA